MNIRPSVICFSQDTINNRFGANTRHGGSLIGDTLDEICEGSCSITDIPPITVVRLNDRWVTSDNRRLWIFRHLERLGKCEAIHVRVGRYIPFTKLTSKNRGATIVLRRDPGGRWYLRQSIREPTVSIPDEEKTSIDKTNAMDRTVHERKRRYDSFATQLDISTRQTLNQENASSRTSLFGYTKDADPKRSKGELVYRRDDINTRQEGYQGDVNAHMDRREEIPAIKGSKQRLLVAALDFGTTNSGYAFSLWSYFLKDPLNIMTNHWSTGAGTSVSFKTPTCILFNRFQHFDSFGFKAEEKYAQLATDGKHTDWFYFKHFKMLLYENKNLNRKTQLADDKGQNMPAMQVFSQCIRFLKNHLLETCMQQYSGIREDEIHWVLTVPAIWNESAKQFMKESAIAAGIANECLSLALEPEAASLYCKQLPGISEEDEDNAITETTFSLDPGTKYIILDAGGGTVDITVHETQRDHTIKELYKANGGPWGGKNIDEAFHISLEHVFGKDTVKCFMNNDRADYLDLLREFERKKQQVHPQLDRSVIFKMPASIYEAYRNVMGKEFICSPWQKIKYNVTFSRDKLQIEPQQVKAMFTETSAKIVDHLKGVMSNLAGKEVDTILMVGGFSESKMLQSAIRKEFPTKTIITPADAGMAILKGAVIFGHTPEVVVSRVSKCTYGVGTCLPFRQGVHPITKRKVIDNAVFCLDYFDKHVERGQAVAIGMVFPEKTYFPVSRQYTSIDLQIYASDRKSPGFVDEFDCSYLGVVNVDLSDIGPHSNKDTRVKMIYGDTELHVEARIAKTGKLLKAQFDFLG